MSLADGSVAHTSCENFSNFSTMEITFPSEYMTESIRNDILDCMSSNYKIKIQDTNLTNIVTGYITNFTENYELSGKTQKIKVKLTIREHN